jgi:predicted nucleic acid-binding protein
MNDAVHRVVFDCNVFAQALITPAGKSAECVAHVLGGRVRLFWSDYVIAEIRRISEKPTPKKLGITAEQVESLIVRLMPLATWVAAPPSV